MYLIDLVPLSAGDMKRLDDIPGIPRNRSIINLKHAPIDKVHCYLRAPSICVAMIWEDPQFEFKLSYVMAMRSGVESERTEHWRLVLLVGTAPPLVMEVCETQPQDIPMSAHIYHWPDSSVVHSINQLFLEYKFLTTPVYIRVGEILLGRSTNPA